MSKLKGKRKSDFTSKDIYKYYNKTHTNPLNKNDFIKVTNLFNKKLIDKIYNGAIIQLPGGMGMIGIRVSIHRIKFNDKGQLDLMKSNISTDWGATNKLWEKYPELKHKKYIFHENLHTNGRRFKIVWNRLYCAAPSLYYYRFAPARTFKRGLARFINNNPNIEYYDF